MCSAQLSSAHSFPTNSYSAGGMLLIRVWDKLKKILSADSLAIFLGTLQCFSHQLIG